MKETMYKTRLSTQAMSTRPIFHYGRTAYNGIFLLLNCGETFSTQRGRSIICRRNELKRARFYNKSKSIKYKDCKGFIKYESDI